jgi:hypothetical protein
MHDTDRTLAELTALETETEDPDFEWSGEFEMAARSLVK